MAIHRSQFIDRSKLMASRPLAELILAALIWLVGAFGTAVAFSGGWDMVLSYPANSMFDVLGQMFTLQLTISPTVVGIALATQIGISYWQYTSPKGSGWQYWGSRGLDTFINWMFLNPLFNAVWASLVLGIWSGAGDWAVGIAGAVNIWIAWMIASVPEKSLVN